jgi:prepilin-type processing-associated H-X9-DG protein
MGPVYQSINFSYLGWSQGDGEASNFTGISSRINTFLCPSSGTPQNSVTVNGLTRMWPGNNYFASTGSSLQWLGQKSGVATFGPNGCFAVGGVPTSLRDITDGTANTVVFGEFRQGDWDDNKLSIQDVVGITDYSDFGAANRNMDCATCSMPAGAGGLPKALALMATTWRNNSGNYGGAYCNFGGSGAQRSQAGAIWHAGLYEYSMGNLIVPPNSAYPYAQFWDTNCDSDSGHIFGLTSFHPGGANALFGDGSVRFLKSSIAYTVLWSLGSMNAGDVISADSY